MATVAAEPMVSVHAMWVTVVWRVTCSVPTSARTMVIASRVLVCSLLASWVLIVQSVAAVMDMELVMTQELASAIKAGMAMTAH